MVEPYKEILKMYNRNPLYKIRYNREFRKVENQFYQDTLSIKNIKLKDYSLKELDRNYPKRNSNLYVLAKLLAYMSPAKVLKRCGEEALFWTWIRYNDGERSKLVLEEYAKLTGENVKMLENAKNAEWRIYHEYNTLPKDTRNMYKITTKLNEKLPQIDLEEIILKFSKKKSRIKKITDRYSLTALAAEDIFWEGGGYDPKYRQVYPGELQNDRNFVHVVYMDAPVGIALLYDNKPVALTTFAMQKDALQIHQIQGVKERLVDKKCKEIKDLRTKGLYDFNWKKTLVTITHEVARSFDIHKCSIISSQKQRWTKEKRKDGKVHLDMKTAERIYDYTARSLGYERDPKQENNWYRKV